MKKFTPSTTELETAIYWVEPEAPETSFETFRQSCQSKGELELDLDICYLNSPFKVVDCCEENCLLWKNKKWQTIETWSSDARVER